MGAGKTMWAGLRSILLISFALLVSACDWVDKGVGGNIPPRVYDDGPYAVPEGGKVDIGAEIGPLANDEDGGNQGITAKLVEPPKYAAPGGFELYPDGSFTYVHDGSEHYEDYFVYIANDGLSDSEQKNVLIKIIPVNDPPVITGQEVVTVAEDSTITLGPQLLKISDPDNLFPDDFSLEVLEAGENYTFDGSSIKPAKNFNGSIRIPVTVNDGTDNSDPFYLKIAVTPVNDPPEIVAWNQEILTTSEDVSLPITLEALEIFDVEGDAVTLQVQPGNGYVVSDNTVTPAPDWFGELGVNIQVSDREDSTPGRITVIVEPVNDAPRVAADKAVTLEDTDLFIDVTQNDADPEGNDEIDRGSLKISRQPEHGRATVDGNGIRYYPDTNFNGIDNFGYTVADIHGAVSGEGSVTIEITPVNDPPAAENDHARTKEDTPKNIDVTKNDTDPDGSDEIDKGSITIVTPPARGSVRVRPNGTVDYMPKANFYGKDKFTYQVKDTSGAISNVATVSIVIDAVNDPPYADNDEAATNEDKPVTIRVTDGDRDEDGKIDPNSVTIVKQPAHGQATVLSQGRVVYKPALNYHGTDRFTYTVKDDQGAKSNEAEVVIIVRSINDPPKITGQNPLSMLEDSTKRIKLEDLQVVDPDDPYPKGFSLTVRSGENYTLSNDTTVVPRRDFTGTLHVPVTVNDGRAESNVYTLSITVNGVNDPPVIKGDPATQVKEDTRYRFTPKAWDRDPGDKLVFRIQNKPMWASFDEKTGTLTGVPGNGDVGITRGIVISVRDKSGAEAALRPFDITVINVNDAPQITGQNPDPLTTAEEMALAITLGHLEVSDPDNSYPGDFSLRVLDGANYSRTGNTITPARNFTGILTVPVRVNDGKADSNRFDLKVQVTGVNDPPEAMDDVANTNEDEAVDIDVLSNDEDPDGDSLTVTNVQNPSSEGGSVAVGSGGVIHYAPPAGYTGTDRFSYTVSDGNGGTDQATVMVTITAPMQAATLKRPPKTAGYCSMTPDGDSVNGRLSATDPDGDDHLLRFYLEKQASKGTVWLSVDGRFTYQPYVGARGVDHFSYQVIDQQGLKGTGSVKVIIGKTRVMPLGDVITAGNERGVKHAYRTLLRESLAEEGYAVEFVGSQSEAPDKHEGHRGSEVTTEYVAARVSDWLAANPADVVLLHLGSQDFLAGGDAAVSDARIGDILAAIEMDSPGTTVLLAEIIDRYPADPNIALFNRRIAARKEQQRLIVVDQYSVLNYETDLRDGFLPNAQGYAKMASAWHEALREVLDKCP